MPDKPFSILPSEDGFVALYTLANCIAVLTNPHLFYDQRNMPEMERLVMLHDCRKLFEELIK